MTDNAAGWQPDPTGRHEHRYWDGSTWTDNVSDAGVASTDAYEAAAVADAAPAAPSEPSPPPPPVEPTTAGWAEPTTAMPVAGAEPTATWPTPPAPPAPPGYAPPPPGGPIEPPGSGGSKKGLLIGGGILAVIAIIVAVLLLGGGDDKDGESVTTQLAAQFKRGGDLTNAQADCIAESVVDEMGEDAFDGVDFTADEPPEEIQDELFSAALNALEDCDIDPADFGGSTDDTTDTTEGSDDGGDGGDGSYGSDPELDDLYDACADGDFQACDDLYLQSPAGSEYEEFGDTCGDRNEPQGYCVDLYGEDGGGDGGTGGALPDDFEDQLAQIYEDSLGLSSEQAQCLAGKLADAVSSGDITEDEAFSDVFGFLEACDIDPSEISGN